jgi:hypothetical protein
MHITAQSQCRCRRDTYGAHSVWSPVHVRSLARSPPDAPRVILSNSLVLDLTDSTVGAHTRAQVDWRMVTFAVGDAVEAEFEAGWLHGVVTEVVEKPRRIRVTFNPGADDEQVVAFTPRQAIAELRRGPHTPIPLQHLCVLNACWQAKRSSLLAGFHVATQLCGQG